MFVVVADSGMNERGKPVGPGGERVQVHPWRPYPERVHGNQGLDAWHRLNGRTLRGAQEKGWPASDSELFPRAKKNAHNREKGVERLKKAYARGTLTKDKVNADQGQGEQAGLQHKQGRHRFHQLRKDRRGRPPVGTG